MNEKEHDPQALLREYAKTSLYGWLKKVAIDRLKGEIDILAYDKDSLWAVEGELTDLPTTVSKEAVEAILKDMWDAVEVHLDIFLEGASPVVEDGSMKLYKLLNENTGSVICGMSLKADGVHALTMK